MTSLSASHLFDESAAWGDFASASDAFSGLLLSPDFQRSALRIRPGHENKPLRAGSVRVYGAMFNRYLESLRARGRTLLSAETADIAAFLDSLEATSRIRWRYVRLLERVHAHLLERGLTPNNPVSPLAVKVALKSPGRDAPMASLSGHQAAQLLSRVSAFTDHQALEASAAEPGPLRAAAIVSVLIGAGLTVAELRHLRRSDLRPEPPGRDWTVRVVRPSTVKPHDTKLGAAWVPALSRWLNATHLLHREDALVFPSAQGSPLVASTIHRIVEQCVEAAVGKDSKACARTLRNTFAQRVIADHGPELAEQYLGLRSEQGMRRYLAACPTKPRR